MRYLQTLLRDKRGSVVESDANLGAMALRKATEFKTYALEAKDKHAQLAHRVESAFLEKILAACDEFIELYQSLMDPEYIQRQTHARVDVFREDLMRVTWHPSRAPWWMDEELKQDLCM
jgi:hypothetical protein